MGLAVDFVVLDRLRTAVSDLCDVSTPAASALRTAMVGEILGGYSAAEIAREWAEFKANPPQILQAFEKGNAGKFACFWVVMLQPEDPSTAAGNKVQHATVTLSGTRCRVVGSGWLQRVQVLLFAKNAESARTHYHVAASLLHVVGDQMMNANQVNRAYPVSGGDATVDPRLNPVGENVGVFSRYIGWAFGYEQHGFIPDDAPGTSVTVTPTPVSTISISA